VWLAWILGKMCLRQSAFGKTGSARNKNIFYYFYFSSCLHLALNFLDGLQQDCWTHWVENQCLQEQNSESMAMKLIKTISIIEKITIKLTWSSIFFANIFILPEVALHIHKYLHSCWFHPQTSPLGDVHIWPNKYNFQRLKYKRILC